MLLLILKVNSQHFLRPCAKLKSDIKKLNFRIGVLKQFGTTWQVSYLLYIGIKV